ncbi:hypothetical protein LIX60_01810 [Streptomyces sp. S07_1.15]|uniref:hypothetical protein n=1 Tax=Streptomyces sp. S07_1.15 TaxID=2873925 RepID=UPI001D1554B3|nr:hypothetical protein [Streptomyces sp. S07_1.15]MCC3650253.1 hypothetical protein [Streptomyces sp. S07_1.15]
MKLAELGRRAPWAVVLIILLAITLSVLPFALFPDTVTTTQTALATVCSIVLLVFALFGLVHDTYSAWQLVVVLCLLLVAVGIGLVAWRYVEESRSLPVTESVKLSKGAASLETGEKAVIRLRTPAPRDRLRLTFEADDLGYGSPCVPSSSLRVTGGADGGRPEARIGEEISVALDPEKRTVRLEAELVSDPGCELSLRVARAVLDND